LCKGGGKNTDGRRGRGTKKGFYRREGGRRKGDPIKRKETLVSKKSGGQVTVHGVRYLQKREKRGARRSLINRGG